MDRTFREFPFYSFDAHFFFDDVSNRANFERAEFFDRAGGAGGRLLMSAISIIYANYIDDVINFYNLC